MTRSMQGRLRLYLLRHAKSSWGDPDLPDHDRPLAPRGTRAAVAMADALARDGLRLDAVFSSSAVRARETCQLVLASLSPEPIIDPALYLASWRDLLRVLREQGPDVGDVALVGHNPGMHELAVRLAGDGPPMELRRLREKFPTCALAEMEFDLLGWAEVGPGSGRLMRFLRPKDFPAARERRL